MFFVFPCTHTGFVLTCSSTQERELKWRNFVVVIFPYSGKTLYSQSVLLALNS